MSLKGEDFPNMQFWTCKQWQLFRDSQENLGMHREDSMHGHQQDQLKPSCTLAYVTNTAGIGPDGYQAGEIQATCHCIWTTIAATEGIPPRWSQAPLPAVKYFHAHMYDTYPDLWLCQGHWKVDLLASEDYPAFLHSCKDMIAMVKKVEDTATDSISNHTLTSSSSRKKHCKEATSCATRKKYKLGNGHSCQLEPATIPPLISDSAPVSLASVPIASPVLSSASVSQPTIPTTSAIPSSLSVHPSIPMASVIYTIVSPTSVPTTSAVPCAAPVSQASVATCTGISSPTLYPAGSIPMVPIPFAHSPPNTIHQPTTTIIPDVAMATKQPSCIVSICSNSMHSDASTNRFVPLYTVDQTFVSSMFYECLCADYQLLT